MRRISGWVLGCLWGICVTTEPARAQTWVIEQATGVAWPDGRIAPGMDADLALPGHDPATDVLALADVVRVMRAGEIQYEAAEQPRSAQR